MSAGPNRGESGVRPWSGPGSTSLEGPGKPTGRRTALYLGLVAVALVVVVVLFVTLFVLPHRNAGTPPPPAGTVLVPAGHSYDVFGGQSASDSFTLATGGTLHGAFESSYPITAFVLTDEQYHVYAHSGNVTSYQWASGSVTSYTIDASLPAGSWNLAFIDLNVQSTSVLVTTDIVVTTP
jgi:hypothetical protein